MRPRPSRDDLWQSVARTAPQFAGDLSFLREGEDFWAYRSGEHVVRVAKGSRGLAALELERRRLPELAPTLPVSIPVPLTISTDTVDQAFGVYTYVPGVPALSFRGTFSKDFGAQLGTFVRALHSFPIERAARLGARVVAGEQARLERVHLFEEVRQSLYPLLAEGVRRYLEDGFTTNLSESSNFDFRPRLVHRDLDGHANVLVSEDGDLAGVIDFSDMVVGNPAVDLWMPLREFEELGIANQAAAALESYGLHNDQLPAVQRELDFLRFFWSFSGLLSGLKVGDEKRVAFGMDDLREAAGAAGYL